MLEITHIFLDNRNKIILKDVVHGFIESQVPQKGEGIFINLTFINNGQTLFTIEDELEPIIQNFCFRSIAQLRINGIYDYIFFSSSADITLVESYPYRPKTDKYISFKSSSLTNINGIHLEYNEFIQAIFTIGSELLDIFSESLKDSPLMNKYISNLSFLKNVARYFLQNEISEEEVYSRITGIQLPDNTAH